MICLSCKQQIPDDSDRCPNCGAEVFHKNQLVKEIGFRRYQRWIFYCVFILVLAGAVGFAVKIYYDNSQILVAMADTKNTLSQKETALNKAQAALASLQKEKDDLASQNQTVSDNLAAQIATAQANVDQLTALQSQVGQNNSAVNFLNSLQLIGKNIATPISTIDLDRIPLADVAYGGVDTDHDGLPDSLEAALGTSASSTDSDSDTYSDRAELLSGFDPLSNGGKLPIDPSFANAQKGKLFTAPGGNLWFVGSDAKRYFLGKAG